MSTVKTTKTAKVETKPADKVVATKVETAKSAVKTETPKTEAVKKAEPVKKTETVKKAEPAKKAEAVKKAEPVKKAPAKKAAAKPVAAKKAPAKKAEKAVEEVYIEYAGSQVSTADIVAKVVEATGKKASSIKTLNVYVQPEFGIAYYTVDGTEGKINY